MVDYLDSMAWDVAISAVLLSVAALRLPYNAATGIIEAEGSNLRVGLAAAVSVTGLYLFITSRAISFQGPLSISNPKIWSIPYEGYNVLFGGIGALGGLALLAISAALFLNAGFNVVSYFAGVLGLYAVVDAAAILNYKLTKAPEFLAMGYLSVAAVAFLSIPATHLEMKWMRWLFAVVAILFTIAWLYQAATFTWSHLALPPPPPQVA